MNRTPLQGALFWITHDVFVWIWLRWWWWNSHKEWRRCFQVLLLWGFLLRSCRLVRNTVIMKLTSSLWLSCCSVRRRLFYRSLSCIDLTSLSVDRCFWSADSPWLSARTCCRAAVPGCADWYLLLLWCLLLVQVTAHLLRASVWGETCLRGPAGFTEPGSVVPVSSSTCEALNSLDRVVFLTESWSIDRRSTWVSVVFNRLSLHWPQFGKQVTSSSSSVSSIRLYSHGGRPHWLFTVFSVKNRIFVSSPHWKLEDIHSMIVNIWCSLKYLPDKLI